MTTLHSMTAYARYASQIGEIQCVWELRSVNHRFLDAHVRLPDSVRHLEPTLKQKLSTKLGRGHVDVTLNLVAGGGQPANRQVSHTALRNMKQWQSEVLDEMPNARPLSVFELLEAEGILEELPADESSRDAALLQSFDTALGSLLEHRASEGRRLQAVIQHKLEAIISIKRGLQSRLPAYQAAHKERWRERVEALYESEIDPVRLHQEIALLMAKADVSEELDRLESHFSEFQQALQSEEPVGRRLDFLLQEFNREANTLGSKSIHEGISNASVEMKVLIDQIKEQVANIE